MKERERLDREKTSLHKADFFFPPPPPLYLLFLLLYFTADIGHIPYDTTFRYGGTSQYVALIFFFFNSSNFLTTRLFLLIILTLFNSYVPSRFLVHFIRLL